MAPITRSVTAARRAQAAATAAAAAKGVATVMQRVRKSISLTAVRPSTQIIGSVPRAPIRSSMTGTIYTIRPTQLSPCRNDTLRHFVKDSVTYTSLGDVLALASATRFVATFSDMVGMTERLHWCRQFLALGGIVVVKDVTAACGVSPELYHMLYENSVAHLAPLYDHTTPAAPKPAFVSAIYANHDVFPAPPIESFVFRRPDSIIDVLINRGFFNLTATVIVNFSGQ